MADLRVLVDGRIRTVRGLSRDTVAADVISALCQATGRAETTDFALFEKWAHFEREVELDESPLALLAQWGKYQSEVQFAMKSKRERRRLHFGVRASRLKKRSRLPRLPLNRREKGSIRKRKRLIRRQETDIKWLENRIASVEANIRESGIGGLSEKEKGDLRRLRIACDDQRTELESSSLWKDQLGILVDEHGSFVDEISRLKADVGVRQSELDDCQLKEKELIRRLRNVSLSGDSGNIGRLDAEIGALSRDLTAKLRANAHQAVKVTGIISPKRRQLKYVY